MRISDWSSDVCSSDLQRQAVVPGRKEAEHDPHQDDQRHAGAHEVDEAVVARVHHQQVGLVADRRGEGAVGGEDHRHGKGLHWDRSEEHTSELQSLMRTSYAVFCLKKKKTTKNK